MTNLQLPNDLVNGTNADASPVEQNFNLIQSFCNNELVNRDGSVAMTAPLLLSGDPTQANHAATKDYVDSVLPVGIMLPWPGKVAPAGNWMVCDGRSLSQSAYPELYGVLGQSFGGGTGTFLLPNMTGRTAFGVDPARAEMSAVGKVGGTFAVPLPQHVHSMGAHTHWMSHTHTIDHTHARATTNTAGLHVHNIEIRINSSAGTVARPLASSTSGTTSPVGGSVVEARGDHNHLVDVPGFNGASGASSASSTGAPSVGNTDNTGTPGAEMTPPFVAMLYIIRVA